MTVTSREENITERLSEHWLDQVGAFVSPMPRDTWADAWQDLGPYARFGIGVPTPWQTEDGKAGLIVPFQPALIAEVAADLKDEDFYDYLSSIELLIDGIIIRLCTHEEPIEQAVIAAESELYDEHEGNIVLLGDTQLRALQRGVTP